jgi:ABC-2 type transport system ATP-binding protein
MSDVIKTYPGFKLALPEFNLSRGHLHVLIGPNGAGKSTLLRLLIGLSLPDRGTIELFGKNMPGNEAEIKLHTGYVAAEMGFPAHVDAKAAIDYVARFYPNWSQEERYRLMAAFELPEERKFNKLSTGQRMRVLLLTAFARQADLLLLDEPFASLDPLGKETLKEEMMEYLLDDEKSILLATNELTDVEDVIDYIHIISHGRIVVSAPPDELCANVSRYSFTGSRRSIKLKKNFKRRVFFKGDRGIAVVAKDADQELAILEDAGAVDITPEDVTLKDVIRYYFGVEAGDAE